MYRFLIRIIRQTVLRFNLQHEFSWEHATVDFEGGAISAFRDSIGFVELHGCHFHFCQAIFRHLTVLGLKREYMDSRFSGFSIFVRSVFALAFLPMERIRETFEALLVRLDEDYEDAGRESPQGLVEFIVYIHRTWLGDNPKYSKELWNVGNLGDRRTNNYVEGWHSACLRHFGVGTNLWKFIHQLQKLEIQNRATLQLHEAGENLPNRTARQKRKEHKIETILYRYNRGGYRTDLSFIRALAYLQADFIDEEENI